MAKGLDIHSLMKQSPNKAKDRTVWGLPLNGLWIPFFMGTNAVKESNIDSGSLGCPLRLSVDKDGVPKLKDDGSARYTVDKNISKAVNGVKDNIAFGLMAFTATIQKTHAEEYKAQVDAAQKAGETIREHEDTTLGAYLAELETMAAKGATIAEAPIESKSRELVPA
ncbi:MAG: hypothetical protein Q8O55_08845 [Dehalococcoidales bacterium]|nr:hypothetical protein [Dehalococcoidales bacterium]